MLSPTRLKDRWAVAAPLFFLVVACGPMFERPALSPQVEARDDSNAPLANEGPSTSPSVMGRARLRSLMMPGGVEDICDEHEREELFVDCLLDHQFGSDPDALALARKVASEHGIVLGSESPRVMQDGDYRGRVVVESAVPVGTDRQHLEILLRVFEETDRIFGAIADRASSPVTFVVKPRAVRFFRTANTTTPSAYALDGVISYNLRGELWTSLDSVVETFVHELFHLSDAAHGRWSERALRPTYERILAQCRDDQECLDRYAPYETKVDGGVYYAFHPTSDVREYAAELAARYFREQKRQLDQGSKEDVGATFKCQAPENEVAWRSLADEFFGGLDLVPEC